ncbi:androgen-dependent TFPI-regulating protein-like [Periplaneta americana]|uniref:androgen-dependent TFPI-regulating protein-like n=1 Tax=Periplaneta americana TaxID=6978 RepID=UPI0037E780A1
MSCSESPRTSYNAAPYVWSVVEDILSNSSEIRKTLLQVIHGAGLLHHSYVIYYAANVFVNAPDIDDQLIRDVKRFHSCYFSEWNFTIQTIYLIICLMENTAGHKLKAYTRTALKRLKDFIFTTMIFPFSMFVSSLFWGLYMVDRELVLPQSFEQVAPQWINYSVHTVTFLLMLVDLLLERKNLHRQFPSLTTLYLFCVAYDVTLISVSFLYDTALYPVLNLLSNEFQLLLVLLSCNISILGFFHFGANYLFVREKQV